jgi:hypothetical protein
MQLFGHTATHRPQPLHRSILIIILPAIFRIAYIVLRLTIHERRATNLSNRILTGPDVAVKSKGNYSFLVVSAAYC